MNFLLKSAVFSTALALISPAMAKPLNVSVELKPYRGNKAYVVAYIVDPKGRYVSTVHAAGKRNKYLADLPRWYRMMKRSRQGIDGSTGASIGSGRQFTTTVDIPDNLFNAGYTLRVETAVEDRGYNKNDARISLDHASKNKPVKGTGYVKRLMINH